MEPLWSPVVATSGNPSQIATPQKPQKHAKTVAEGCDRLRPGPHGKEGVSGSSPERPAHERDLGERALQKSWKPALSCYGSHCHSSSLIRYGALSGTPGFRRSRLTSWTGEYVPLGTSSVTDCVPAGWSPHQRRGQSHVQHAGMPSGQPAGTDCCFENDPSPAPKASRVSACDREHDISAAETSSRDWNRGDCAAA
jgi:hypothetical protein